MEFNLNGKTALITGSTEGIGLAIAEFLAQSGARVIINGRDKTSLDNAKKKLSNSRFEVDGVLADLSLASGIEDLIKTFPEVDILINNLGMYSAKDFFEISDSEWEEMLNINLFSGVRLSRHYLKKMLERGSGRIIFIASEVGLNPDPSMMHYSVSKTAMLALSRGLAEKTKGTSVTVNSIAPGPTATEGLRKYIGGLYPGLTAEAAETKFMAEVRPSSITGRLATTSEVASLATFISSDLAGSINGATIKTEGGTVRSFT